MHINDALVSIKSTVLNRRIKNPIKYIDGEGGGGKKNEFIREGEGVCEKCLLRRRVGEKCLLLGGGVKSVY